MNGKDLKHGYCHKASPSIGGGWGKKWLVLTPTELKYYSSSSSTSPKQVIPLVVESVAERVRSGVDRRAWDSVSYIEKRGGAVVYKKIKKLHVLSFAALVDPHSMIKKRIDTRTWYFQFSCDEERDEWLVAINEAATENAKTEASLAGFLQRQKVLKTFTNEASLVFLAEGYTLRRNQNNARDESSSVQVASLMGNLELKYQQDNDGALANLREQEYILKVATKMAENGSQGIVDFDLQREYLDLVSKNPTLKASIMAPAWAQEIMLPDRGGLWIDTITPCSPASYVPGVEIKHDVIVAINSSPFPGEPAEAIEFIGRTRWGLTERGFDTTYTIYNLKTREFRLYVLPPNPGNLPKAPMASGMMGKWVKGPPDNGIVPNNLEPTFPPL